MAAPVSTQPPFGSRRFRDDTHWMKLKSAVYSFDRARALVILSDYKYKDVDDKLDQFILKLVDEGNIQAISCLTATMRTVYKVTDFSRVCELGAALKLSQMPVRGSRNLPYLAEAFANEFRTYDGVEWKVRAAFMDTIAAAKGF